MRLAETVEFHVEIRSPQQEPLVGDSLSPNSTVRHAMVSGHPQMAPRVNSQKQPFCPRAVQWHANRHLPQR